MLRLLDPPAGGLVVDAGCGTGVHSIRAAKLRFRVRALDISNVVLQTARRNAQEAGVADRIEFEQGDLTNLPFADSSVQHIFSWGVIIHVPQIEQALREIARVLKPGGRVALQITNSRAWDYRVESMARFLLHKPLAGQERLPMGIGGWCDMHGGKLYNWRIDIKALTNLMRDLGCKRIHRSAAEFTELQRRSRNAAGRTMFRLMNRAWLSLHLPPGPAITNVLVFAKPS